MTVSCPECGTSLTVPARPKKKSPARAAPARKSRAAPKSADPKASARKPRPKTSAWLYLTQAALGALGLSCFVGALFYAGWKPPPSSYFALSAAILIPAGLGILGAGWLAARFPLFASESVAIFALCVCAQNYYMENAVDVSRVLALSVAMLALWLALQHRRAITN